MGDQEQAMRQREMARERRPCLRKSTGGVLEQLSELGGCFDAPETDCCHIYESCKLQGEICHNSP